MLVTLLAANRNLLIELRQSSNQAQAAAAFEAAEAGLDWAVAMLNADARIGTDCKPSPLATQSFRERHLDTALPAFTPQGRATALRARRRRLELRLPRQRRGHAGGQRRRVRAALRGGCNDGRLRVVATSGALAEHSASIALQPALAAPPAAALTVRPAGLAAEPFFAGLFGFVEGAMAAPAGGATDRLPRRLRRGDRRRCRGARPAFALPGDLTLRGPLTLGSPERPLLIVAAGPSCRGAVQLHGVAHAASLA